MKTLYIIAGANGSGKTTFAKSFIEGHQIHFINADELARELDSEHIVKEQIKAGRAFFDDFKKRLVGNKSFMIETTLSGKYLAKYIKQAHKRSFFVHIIYLFLEKPETNITRVANRVLKGWASYS